jgi:hypothetical protein
MAGLSFYMLLALASVVFLGSESLSTRDHILMSQIWDFRFRRLLRLAGSRWRYSTPPPRGWSESQSHIATDGQSISLSVLVSSLIWGSWPDISYCLTVTVLFFRPLWREDGSVFCICCWPSPQRSLSRVRCLRFETSVFVASYDSQSVTVRVRVTLRLTVTQSVCLSWCRAPFGAHDQILVTVWQLLSCPWEGALSN